MARGEETVDVELVEERDGIELPWVGAAEPDRAADPAARARRRRAGVVSGGLVLALVGATLGWGAWQDLREVQRDEARVAALAEVPGAAPSLREPLEELWSTEVPATSLTGGLLITADEAFGELRTSAHDVATGELRWRREVARDPGDPEPQVDACEAAVEDGGALLCEVPSTGQRAPNTDAELGGDPRRLVVLDAEDGAVRHVRDLGSTTIGWQPLGDDLVVARRDGRDLVLERSALDGTVTWSTRVPDLLEEGATSSDLRLEVSDGLVHVSGRAAAVLDEDGTVLGRWRARAERDDGLRVTTSSVGFTVVRGSGGTWADRAGGALVSLGGQPLAAGVDDGAHPYLELLRHEGRLRAVDVRSGGVRWGTDAADRALLRVGDLVVLDDAVRLRALDLRTGEELWDREHATGILPLYPVVTDGVRLLVPSWDLSEGRSMMALDLGSGEEVWRAPQPSSARVVVVERTFVHAVGDSLRVLG
ncbi:PQQ-binding-like beta-propeller repeat protein [Actinotalea sp. C106]|uniref:outer membrane protein assembly factor BamB family protein n=1 Tax=Actinotalea sp. C106 TaxID=2908644 RepID=UPI002028FDF0|nr:PQQ-binding-like beta-propeller repeat protein [Actinotalea sp. C106]